MTDVTLKGIDVTALMNAAASQPQGSQKAKYTSDLATLLGNNAVFIIRVGSTVVYSSTVVGAITTSADGLLVPPEFVEPPSVNVANALTDSAAVIVLRNASNSSVELTVPVKAGGATNFLTASAALDGTKLVRTSSLLLRAPSSLDAGAGEPAGDPPAGSPLIALDDLIDDMTLASPIFPRYGTPNNAQAACLAANYENVKGFVDDGPVTAWKFYDYMDEILPWFWVYAGPDHTDGLGLRLQYRNGVISVKRVSTGAWVDSTVRSGLDFAGYKWNGNSNTGVMSTDFRNDTADNARSSLYLDDDGCELWFPAVVNRSLIADCRAVAIIAECRIINDDGTPYFGASPASYAIHMGFDFYGRNAPGTGFFQDEANDKYWGNGANGSNSRWIEVTDGNWKSCAMVTMVAYNDQPGNQHLNDWGAATPWTLYPYIPNEAEIRANPPSWTTT